jgi:hypothetical protein
MFCTNYNCILALIKQHICGAYIGLKAQAKGQKKGYVINNQKTDQHIAPLGRVYEALHCKRFPANTGLTGKERQHLEVISYLHGIIQLLIASSRCLFQQVGADLKRYRESLQRMNKAYSA